MKLKLYEIQKFLEVYNRIKDTTMPIKTGYKLAKISARCQKEMDIYQSQLNKIILEYGARDENDNLVHTEDGTGVKIKEDKISECQEKLNELSFLEVDIDEDPISINGLENIELSLDDIRALSSFLSEE